MTGFLQIGKNSSGHISESFIIGCISKSRRLISLILQTFIVNYIYLIEGYIYGALHMIDMEKTRYI